MNVTAENRNGLLRVSDLRTYLDVPSGVIKAVDGVSLAVNRKEAVALVGESGSGKSMTALTIIRLQPVVARILSGEILLNDVDLLKLDTASMCDLRGTEVAMVFQDPMTYLNPVMRAGAQVAEVVLEHQDVSKGEARSQVLDAFERVGIPSPQRVYDSYPHQLSGGMRQRVLIAMAISCRPSLLIADEPTTALDVTIQAQIMDLLAHLREELQNALFLITHDIGLVAEHCDRIYIMYAGQIVEHADTFTLFAEPKHPYTEGLLRSTLSPDKRVEVFETIEGQVPNPTDMPSGCRFHPRCPHVKDICREESPPSLDLGEGRMVACWLYD